MTSLLKQNLFIRLYDSIDTIQISLAKLFKPYVCSTDSKLFLPNLNFISNLNSLPILKTEEEYLSNFYTLCIHSPGSIVLDVLEKKRVFNGVRKSIAVLDMTGVVANARVENVTQRVLAQEQVAQHPHCLGVLVFQPHAPQISNRINRTLILPQLIHELFITDSHLPQNKPHLFLIFLEERDYCFPVVFWNVLRLVLKSPLLLLQALLPDIRRLLRQLRPLSG